MADWWADFFDDTLAELFLVRADEGELAATLAFLTERLALGPGSAVFDQCCGIGSLSIPLARRGVRVVGVDQCAPYIERARRESAGLPANYEVGDALAFIPAGPCDGTFNWYSSFGYADSDERNLEMLRRAFAALRPGGRFALDYLNVAGLLERFQRCLLRRHPSPAGEVLLVRDCELDLPRGVVRQRWLVVHPDGRRRERTSEVRLYLPHALGDLLRRAGFEEVSFCGGVRGEELTPGCPRCIVLARKP